jgi:hypothetical protein
MVLPGMIWKDTMSVAQIIKIINVGKDAQTLSRTFISILLYQSLLYYPPPWGVVSQAQITKYSRRRK